jgi:hypothetical protein
MWSCGWRGRRRFGEPVGLAACHSDGPGSQGRWSRRSPSSGTNSAVVGCTGSFPQVEYPEPAGCRRAARLRLRGLSPRRSPGPCPTSRNGLPPASSLTERGGANLEHRYALNCVQRRSTNLIRSAVTCGFSVSAGRGTLRTCLGGQGVAGSNPVVPTADRAVSPPRGAPPIGLSDLRRCRPARSLSAELWINS